jgi:aminopeptidase N
MIETTIGKENFVKGLDLYHSRFKHSNATRKDWIAAMEEVSGKELQAMAESWLKQTGYPTVEVKKEYKNKTLTLSLTQSGQKEGALWQFPFVVAACDKNGKVLAEELLFIKNKSETLTFKDISEPAFLSLNREYSFYGKVKYAASDEELFLQVMHDTDMVNRYMAFYELLDKEKLRLLKNTTAEVDEKIIKLFFNALNDKKLMTEVSSSFVAIFEDVSDVSFAHKYQDLYDVKEKLLKAIATKHEDALLKLYDTYADKKYSGSLVEQRIASIKDRQVKNACLGVLSRLDNSEVHKIIKKQFITATNASDKNTAFSLYLNSSASDKLKLLEEYEKEAKTHLVSWENFLIAVGSNDSADYLSVIKRVISSPSFRIEQANDQRAVFGVFAHNKKKSLLTEEGRKFLQESILKLAPINEYNTVHMIKAFGTLDKIAEEHQVPLVQSIVTILKTLSPEKNPSVYNTLKRILFGSPKAIKVFEKVHGKVDDGI